MSKQREMDRYEAHLAACRASLKDAQQKATEAAKKSGATIHPRVAAIKKTAAPATTVVPHHREPEPVRDPYKLDTTQEKT